MPQMVKLPWIPGEAEWLQLLEVFRAEPVRNRVMLALAYGAALRCEELCSLRTDDLDPARRASPHHDDDPKFRRAGAQVVAIISRHYADTARSYLMHQS